MNKEQPVKTAYGLNLEETVKKWKSKKGSLIMILHDIQARLGYVPREISLELSNTTGIPLARIYEVLTFYNFFRITPPAKHRIAVCQGTACYLKGAPELAAEIEKILEIKQGETSKDGLFRFESVRCVGCCGLAPVVVIDGKVHGKVDRKQLASMIHTCIKAEHDGGNCKWEE